MKSIIPWHSKAVIILKSRNSTRMHLNLHLLKPWSHYMKIANGSSSICMAWEKKTWNITMPFVHSPRPGSNRGQMLKSRAAAPTNTDLSCRLPETTLLMGHYIRRDWPSWRTHLKHPADLTSIFGWIWWSNCCSWVCICWTPGAGSHHLLLWLKLTELIHTLIKHERWISGMTYRPKLHFLLLFYCFWIGFPG